MGLGLQETRSTISSLLAMFAMVACLISPTFSAKEQYFSLTTDQRTVLFNLSFSANSSQFVVLLVNRGVRFDDDENRRQNTEVFCDTFLTEVLL